LGHANGLEFSGQTSRTVTDTTKPLELPCQILSHYPFFWVAQHATTSGTFTLGRSDGIRNLSVVLCVGIP